MIRERLEAAFAAAFPEPEELHKRWAFRAKETRFTRLLDAEAYLDAAIMLLPSEEWGFQIMPLFCVLRHPKRQELDVEAHGKTAVEALLSAIEKARTA